MPPLVRAAFACFAPLLICGAALAAGKGGAMQVETLRAALSPPAPAAFKAEMPNTCADALMVAETRRAATPKSAIPDYAVATVPLRLKGGRRASVKLFFMPKKETGSIEVQAVPDLPPTIRRQPARFLISLPGGGPFVATAAEDTPNLFGVTLRKADFCSLRAERLSNLQFEFKDGEPGPSATFVFRGFGDLDDLVDGFCAR